MKFSSVKLKITLWYTSLIVVVLGFILGAVLFATDDVLLLQLHNKLENKVYDCADNLEADSTGRLRLEKIDFLNDGIKFAVYDESGNFIAGLYPKQLPPTPFKSEFLQTVTVDEQSWYVYDFNVTPNDYDKSVWVRGTVSLSGTYAARDEILFQCLLLFPLLIFLSACGGYIITKKTFRHVTDISQTAESIVGSRDLSNRIKLDNADSEIAELADTFNRMFDRLESAFEAERRFTADASHELRTPTAVIIAQAEYGLRSENPEERTAALKHILNDAKKMSRLLAQLLLLARIDADKYKFEIETFDLSEMAEIILEESIANAEANEMKLIPEVDEGLFIKGDPTLIMRLLMNLLDNAVKYGCPGGTIKLGIKKDGNNAVGYIQDEGIGIKAEDLPKIWQRFYRADNAQSKDGTGLGLAMVKWIVEVHRGTIDVESEYGKGTKFTFTLPLEEI